jgi:hypothetical protein
MQKQRAPKTLLERTGGDDQVFPRSHFGSSGEKRDEMVIECGSCGKRKEKRGARCNNCGHQPTLIQ